MNDKQRLVLIFVVVIIVLMLLFPPFNFHVRNSTMNAGYGFILSPPKSGSLTASVNLGMLVVLLVGSLVWLLLRNSSGSEKRIDIKTEDVKKNESNSEELIKVENKVGFHGGKYHPWRRFFARLVDTALGGLVLGYLLGYTLAGIYPEKLDLLMSVLSNPLLRGFILYILWIPLEAGLLSSFGATPGKWVFGINVLTIEGKALSFARAFHRSVLVWMQGLGFGIPLITLITQVASYRRLIKEGTTLWDKQLQSKVSHKDWGVLRAFICFCLVLGVLGLVGYLNGI